MKDINYYVCSSLYNRDQVKETYKRLNEFGWNLIYDWTNDAANMPREAKVNKAIEEAQAVIDANFVIILLPTRNGAQTEFGMAIASALYQDKKIFIWAEKDEDLYYSDGIDNGWYRNIFYYLPNVKILKCPYERLIEILEEEGHYYKNNIKECCRP